MPHRATICISSDKPEEVAAFESWLEQWKGKMTFISGDYGCGCCVHLYDVAGPKEATDAIPPMMRSHSSEWMEKGKKSGDPSLDILPES